MTPPRFLAVALAASFVLTRTLGAQAIPEFNKLRSPVSPAFTILGIAPSDVERPTMPATFAASLVQRAEDFTSTLPKSFAVEVAPYWWVSHPKLTFTQYEKGGIASLARDFTISIATTDSLGNGVGTPTGNSAFRRLGLGVRTMYFSGDAKGSQLKCVDQIRRIVAGPTLLVTRQVAEAIGKDRSLAADTVRLEQLRSTLWTRALRDSFPLAGQDSLTAATKRCAKDLSARSGLAIGVAAGAAFNFPTGSADSGSFSSIGLWLTPAYLGKNFSNIAVIRLISSGHETDTSSTAFDVGGRSIYAWDRFATSLEAVFRNVSYTDSTRQFVRLTLGFDAKVTDEGWLTMSFGKDFDPKLKNSLRALLGWQWHFGDRTIQPDPPGS